MEIQNDREKVRRQTRARPRGLKRRYGQERGTAPASKKAAARWAGRSSP